MTPRSLRFAVACLLTAGAMLSGCGGGGESTGDAKVPDGYKTYDENGVSFAYPEDWQVDARDGPNGPTVQITPPDKSETPYGLIQLSIASGAGDRFKSQADQRRIVLRDVNKGTIDSDESVDVPGAQEALRAKVTTPPGRGTNPVEVSTDSLDVLRGDDVLVLTAAAPQRDGQPLDPGAVVSSFRVSG